MPLRDACETLSAGGIGVDLHRLTLDLPLLQDNATAIFIQAVNATELIVEQGKRAAYRRDEVCCIRMFVVFALVFRMPRGERGDMGVEGTFKDSLPYLKNKYIWYLGIVFFALCLSTLAVVNTFCQNLGQAVGSPLFGAVLDSMHGNWFMASCSGYLSALSTNRQTSCIRK